MRRILLLGGTGDALKMARRLGANDVYSLAGLGKIAEGLFCHVRVGGFGGADGLARYVEAERIELIVDATHPYAAQISANAALASALTGVECWALRRPAWQPQPGDDWRFVSGWDDVVRPIDFIHATVFYAWARAVVSSGCRCPRINIGPSAASMRTPATSGYA